MRQSLKTRLLSAAYKAACALAERVFAFTEQLRLQKDDSYLGDLYDRRAALIEELREDGALLGELERRMDNARAELDITEREIWPQAPLPRALADFDDLPAPQGVDENEAPAGYKAVAMTAGCTGCAFDPLGVCPNNDDGTVRCFPEFRGDQKDVVFVAR